MFGPWRRGVDECGRRAGRPGDDGGEPVARAIRQEGMPGQAEADHAADEQGRRPGPIATENRCVAAAGEPQLWQIGRRLEASEGLEFFALVPL